MKLSDLAQGEPWMDPEERRTAADLVQSFQQCFTDRQIPENTFLTLRVRDYLLHHTLSSRLERSLTPDFAQESSLSSPPSTPSQPLAASASPPATVEPKLAEQIGKTHDRQRRSLKDLEDTANKLTPPIPSSNEAPKTPGERNISGTAKPYTPLDDYKFRQALIEEVGIDLNDPDFFADEDNFYDFPPYRRPTSAELEAAAAATPAQTEAQSPDPAPDPSEAADKESSVASAKDETEAQEEARADGPPHTPADSHASQPAAPSPAPKSARSTVNDPLPAVPPYMPCIVPTRTGPPPPPKPYIYKVKPTPFNQGYHFK